MFVLSQSGSNESDANMVYDDNVNPKFRVIHPQAPNLQLDEFKLQHELNKRKPMQGARESHIVAPHFDPNKHPGQWLAIEATGTPE